MKRRHFIKTTTSVAPLIGFVPASIINMTRDINPPRLEKRSLGKTGKKLSILGFGGIVVMDATPQQASSRVAEAIDFGVNYFDVAPSYGDAEIKLGPALKPYRSEVFLACKTTERKKDARMGLRFTLSHAVTAAIPPGNEDLFKMALGLATNFKPLNPSEIESIKIKGLAGNPIFKYPQS